MDKGENTDVINKYGRKERMSRSYETDKIVN
jgi:hypothetical protein